ncbi:GNAT family N-acetyltransferase [Flavobacterium sp.]
MNLVLETQRCYLRELNVDDAQSFYDLNADPEVVRYTGDKPFETVQEAKSFLENYFQYQLYGYGRWAVIDKKTNAFIGWCGLKYSADLDEVDLGYRFFRKYWNLGYATETAKACIDFGFNNLNLHKIIGRAMVDNVGSIRVLEKTGMEYVGKFDCDSHPGVLYKIEKTENPTVNNS